MLSPYLPRPICSITDNELRLHILSSSKGSLVISPITKLTFSKCILCGLISIHLILLIEDANVIKLKFEPISTSSDILFFDIVLKAQRS